ncbi:MAG: DNA-binding response regulator [Muricauda sp. TMED12]|nr:MAG: DNA-binding response regulator [Muricauda sp. TMED12]
MSVHCVIIDDEPPARELIRSYIRRLDGFELVGSFSNAIDGYNYMQRNQVDLLFVDIQMPQMNGLELVKGLVPRPKIVFTTAYRQYAADGFDLGVLDYLVKPIVFERFLKSIGKYHQATEQQEELSPTSYGEAYMYFKVDRAMTKVYLKDVLWIESLQDYIRLVTSKGDLIAYSRIGYMERKLPETHFVRIHKSFVVQLQYIDSYTNASVTINGKELPLGRVYKQNFLKIMAGQGASQ